ncbi:hypothetical protein G6F59_014745 [Rhizopus arrhizus]|nr:hypothetical protein G6F59_014745 [Rhizopus arrhizus]
MRPTKIEQGAHIRRRRIELERQARHQAARQQDRRAVDHAESIARQRPDAGALLQRRQHVAGGKAERAQQREAQTQQRFHHTRRDAGAEPQPGVQRVPQRRGGKHHRYQSAGNPLRGGVEAQEIQAEQAKALAYAEPMAAPVQLLQFAGQQQGGEQHQARQCEAVEDGHGNGHHAKLQLDGDPGGAPDDDGQEIQEEIHDAMGRN